MNISRLLVSARIYVCLFAADRRGVTAVEYVMIASLVAILVVAGGTLIGFNVSSKFTAVSGGI